MAPHEAEMQLYGRMHAVEIVVEEALFTLLEQSEGRVDIAKRIRSRAEQAATKFSKDGDFDATCRYWMGETVQRICVSLQARLAGCSPGTGQHRRR